VPLAQGVGLSFIAPLIALYLASVVLNEKVTPSDVRGSLVALVGVFIVIAEKFRIDTDLDSLLGTGAILLAAAGYAYYLIIQRMQALVASPYEIAFFQNFFVVLVMVPATPIFYSIPDSNDVWLGIVVAASLAIGSVVLMSTAYSRAETRNLVAVEYTAFAWAILFGWLFFYESVSVATILGTGCIILGCVLSSSSVSRAR